MKFDAHCVWHLSELQRLDDYAGRTDQTKLVMPSHHVDDGTDASHSYYSGDIHTTEVKEKE